MAARCVCSRITASKSRHRMAKDKEQKHDAKPKGGDKGVDKGMPPQKQAAPKPQGKKDAPKAPPIAKEEGPRIPAPPARLAQFYREKVVPDLTQKFGYKSVMQVPRIKKITLNMGVGETTTDKKVLDNALADMTRIAGQKPVVTKSRKSIANFKVRRTQLLEIIYDVRASDEAKEEARLKLQKLPRDSSPVRLRNRCALTGRPRGVYSKFGLGRNTLRDLALKGEVPGIIKASW